MELVVLLVVWLIILGRVMMNDAVEMSGWKLVDRKGDPVLTGSVHKSFRGECFVVDGGTPPHKPSSGGFVHVIRTDVSGEDRIESTITYYPSVFDMRWVKEDCDESERQ